jgi:phosphoribosylformimino-5-aminoimidazole carboxamide ribotide isomerase
VIVTSYLFPDGKFALDRLEGLEKKVGKEKLIVDISCRRRGDGWVVAMNGWKTLTDMWVTQGMSLSISKLLASAILQTSQYSLTSSHMQEPG